MGRFDAGGACYSEGLARGACCMKSGGQGVPVAKVRIEVGSVAPVLTLEVVASASVTGVSRGALQLGK